ncbi:TPA: Bor family protein [Serratia rubidaea]|uniref:Bor family protein n=1 Tax=unclassified Serratia (in: enterobacteria) TaxID=2647522 RepID=UPI000CF7274E|nr:MULTISPECIES: Bor family protein [unclassified Serratia (in: enterobacteria)]HBZ16863.1 lipoprotein bor [Pantoea sp.]HDJ1442385.1 Bor family protein [Serratia rubidaea]AVJ17518.1 lipoprotein bor [Serratia sp. MYb239]CAE1144069.1 putative lipoprotein; DLP12 prophage [Serratia sp. Tan611]HDJ1450865.1 Bor family protein [Serratia rubidaea]
MKKYHIAVLLTMMVSGCAQQAFTLKNEPAGMPDRTVTHHFFVSGIGQKKTIDAAAVCGGADKVVRTESQVTFVNGLLDVITFGIYTPREARVYCSR